MSQYQEKATVIRIEQFSDVNYRLTLDAPDISKKAKPGQFVMIKAGAGLDPLLRRPFSIHQVEQDRSLQIYFKVVGRGTEMLAQVRQGDVLSLFGPLGRGFNFSSKSSSILVGGGLGIAPMLFLASELSKVKNSTGEDVIILGGRSKLEVEPLVADFSSFGFKLLTSTDDGSFGHHGFVTDVLKSRSLQPDTIVYACGPEAMMAGISEFCRQRDVKCQVSIESVMACGMGACLGCSKPKKSGGYTHVCLNGPVYNAEELVWE